MAKQRLYYLFSWLLHLDQDGDDKKNKNYAWWDADDSAMGLSDLMKKPLRSFLCSKKVNEGNDSNENWEI